MSIRTRGWKGKSQTSQTLKVIFAKQVNSWEIFCKTQTILLSSAGVSKALAAMLLKTKLPALKMCRQVGHSPEQTKNSKTGASRRGCVYLSWKRTKEITAFQYVKNWILESWQTFVYTSEAVRRNFSNGKQGKGWILLYWGLWSMGKPARMLQSPVSAHKNKQEGDIQGSLTWNVDVP